MLLKAGAIVKYRTSTPLSLMETNVRCGRPAFGRQANALPKGVIGITLSKIHLYSWKEER
jgi:hypothetical protein